MPAYGPPTQELAQRLAIRRVVEEAQLSDLKYVAQLANTDNISLRHFGCAVALFSRFSYREIAIRLAGSQPWVSLDKSSATRTKGNELS